MTFIRHLLFAVTLVFAGAAFALDLNSAKSQGLVGEQPNGYLGVVKATSEAVELVSDVNENAVRRISASPGKTVSAWNRSPIWPARRRSRKPLPVNM